MDSSREEEWRRRLSSRLVSGAKSHLTVVAFKKWLAGRAGGDAPPQRGSLQTITINVRRRRLLLHTRFFYNFRQWSLPTNLSGKLALACRAAWSEAGDDLSQIVFFARPASGAVMDGSSGIGEAKL